MYIWKLIKVKVKVKVKSLQMGTLQHQNALIVSCGSYLSPKNEPKHTKNDLKCKYQNDKK